MSVNQWVSEPVGQWASGPVGQWASGPVSQLNWFMSSRDIPNANLQLGYPYRPWHLKSSGVFLFRFPIFSCHYFVLTLDFKNLWASSFDTKTLLAKDEYWITMQFFILMFFFEKANLQTNKTKVCFVCQFALSLCITTGDFWNQDCSLLTLRAATAIHVACSVERVKVSETSWGRGLWSADAQFCEAGHVCLRG